ncbi:MAG: hypothetical protein AB7F86_20085 [Bdellovibrionales bacterium]
MAITKSIGLLALVLLALPSWAMVKEKADHRPMDEMQGNCENFAMDLSGEMRAWEAPAIPLEAGRDLTSRTPLSTNKRIAFKLHPNKETKFLVKPEKSFPTKSPYAGIGLFRPMDTGIYRVSLGQKVWFDLIDKRTGEVVPAKKFEMQTKCDKVFKAVEYVLQADKDYFVQVSSSPKPTVDLIFKRAY